MTIEDVKDEYKDRSYSTLSEKKEIMKNYRRDLIAAGMSEEELMKKSITWMKQHGLQKSGKIIMA